MYENSEFSLLNRIRPSDKSEFSYIAAQNRPFALLKRSCDIIFKKMKVTRFCLPKTISGSYLKQNNNDLVFHTCPIFLKRASS